jgi:AcrR family transcriptional regulator
MSATPTDRPLRADARRNREKVVEAAREAFAEGGLDAQIDDIARRAGVGVGTVYRHFPTKEALLHAVVAWKFAVLAAEARRVLDADGDPWAGLRHVLFHGGETHAADRALSQVWTALPNAVFEEAARETGLRPSIAELLARAQADGSVRADVRVDDVPMVMCAMSNVITAHEHGMAGTWRRFLALVLDGMRARDAAPLPD